MSLWIGRLSGGVGRKQSVTISQGVVDDGVNKAGVSTAAPDRSAVLCPLNGPGLGWLFAPLLLQHTSPTQRAASRVRRVMSSFCEVTQVAGDT